MYRGQVRGVRRVGGEGRGGEEGGKWGREGEEREGRWRGPERRGQPQGEGQRKLPKSSLGSVAEGGAFSEKHLKYSAMINKIFIIFQFSPITQGRYRVLLDKLNANREASKVHGKVSLDKFIKEAYNLMYTLFLPARQSIFTIIQIFWEKAL